MQVDDDWDIDNYTEHDGDGPYFDPYAPCNSDDPNDLWDEQDDYQYWLDECGQIPGQGCLKAGSEECDWECPFSNELYYQPEPEPAGLLVRATTPIRNWWSDVSFRKRHCAEDYQIHAHWVRLAWGLEDEEYCPF